MLRQIDINMLHLVSHYGYPRNEITLWLATQWNYIVVSRAMESYYG